MGQYYNPTNLTRRQWLYSHSYDSGLKLMEHSWLKNQFVRAVERLLIPGGAWHKTRLVWAGDYADNGAHVPKRLQEAYKKWYLKYHAEHAAKYPDQAIPNVYDLGMGETETVKFKDKEKKVKAPKWAFKEVHPEPLTDAEAKRFHFIVNHTKKEFVNKNTVPNSKGWRVHPLSLLTSSGNGRGGGDYHPLNDHDVAFVGVWAGDVISIEEVAPKGYTKIKPDFLENW